MQLVTSKVQNLASMIIQTIVLWKTLWNYPLNVLALVFQVAYIFCLSSLVHTSFRKWWHHKQSRLSKTHDWFHSRLRAASWQKQQKTDILLTNARKQSKDEKGPFQQHKCRKSQDKVPKAERKRSSTAQTRIDKTDQLETKPQVERISHRGVKQWAPGQDTCITHTQSI